MGVLLCRSSARSHEFLKRSAATFHRQQERSSAKELAREVRVIPRNQGKVIEAGRVQAKA
jgi:hypothetical protein